MLGRINAHTRYESFPIVYFKTRVYDGCPYPQQQDEINNFLDVKTQSVSHPNRKTETSNTDIRTYDANPTESLKANLPRRGSFMQNATPLTIISRVNNSPIIR